MKSRFLFAVPVLASICILGGCATKKYVATQVDPVRAKVDTVDTQLQDTQKQVTTQGDAINATREIAKAADAKAVGAQSSADAASQKSDLVRNQLQKQLADTVGSLDNYKAATEVTVNFDFNSAKLTPDDEQSLDKFAATSASLHRYFIALVGHTDKIGPANYNLALSRRRAEAVQNYLIAKGNIPVFRIQIVGMGKAQPVDDGSSKDARAKNRRVDLTLYSSDAAMAASQSGAAGSSQ